MLHGTQRGGGEEGSKHADSASPSLPRYSLSRRLFDSPEREENYGKNETEGKNDEGEGREGGRGESRTGKHRTRVNICPQGPLLGREQEEVDRDDIISQLKRMLQQGRGIPSP